MRDKWVHSGCRLRGAAGFLPAVAALFLIAGFLGGCLSRPSLARQNFTFSIPTPSPDPASAPGRVLSIRRLAVAAPFESQSFVYRTGESSYEADPYAQFLVPPQESLAEPIRAYLRNAGIFAAVTEPGSGVSPNLSLEISVTQLYGDFRDPRAPASVVSIRFLFFDSTGLPTKILFEKEYCRRIPIKARTAAGAMAGWNEGLKQIMEALRADERF